MALTPEQILNKHFQTTQFRKGYDERDVDDFLDEIVAEMRTLVSQRNDIRQQLEECRAGRGQAKDGTPTATAGPAVGAPADGSATEQAHAELAQLQARITAAEAREKELSERAARAQREVESLEAAVKDRQSTLGKSVWERLDAAETNARAAVGARQAAEQRTGELEQELHDLQAQHTSLQDHRSEMAQADAQHQALEAQARDQDSNTGAMRVVAAGAGGAVAGGSAAALIELAQRLHDEHVGTGEAKREELISDGRRQYDELVGTAQSRHDELLSTAQSQHDELVGTAQERHDSLIAEATSRHEELITEGRERSTGMVAEAQQRKAAVLAELEHEKGMLEKKIEELRGFERTYRSQLKSYLQSQLEELDHTGVDAASEREATAPEDTGQDNG